MSASLSRIATPIVAVLLLSAPAAADLDALGVVHRPGVALRERDFDRQGLPASGRSGSPRLAASDNRREHGERDRNAHAEPRMGRGSHAAEPLPFAAPYRFAFPLSP